MNCPWRLDRISFGLALSALTSQAACGTKELSPQQVLVDSGLQPTASQGSLGIFVAPPQETYAEFQTAGSQPVLHVLADGKDLVSSHEDLWILYAGYTSSAGNYEAGLHHFAIGQVG